MFFPGNTAGGSEQNQTLWAPILRNPGVEVSARRSVPAVGELLLPKSKVESHGLTNGWVDVDGSNRTGVKPEWHSAPARSADASHCGCRNALNLPTT